MTIREKEEIQKIIITLEYQQEYLKFNINKLKNIIEKEENNEE